MSVVYADVTTEPLSVEDLLARVDAPEAGAVATFIGRIRNHDPEASGEVVALDYSGHPEAARMIGEIAERVAAALDPEQVARIAVAHRIGRLVVGDLALVACVSSPHRATAFRVCEELVEAIKRELPIWKQQHESSGRAVWSNLGLDADG